MNSKNVFPKLCLLVGAAALILNSCATGRTAHETDSAAANAYGHLMHNRFYEAWSQPKLVSLPRGKISVPVDVEIDRAGHVRKFQIVHRSGNDKIDNSIASVARTVTQVAPPPLATRQDRFDLRIYFELDVK